MFYYVTLWQNIELCPAIEDFIFLLCSIIYGFESCTVLAALGPLWHGGSVSTDINLCCCWSLQVSQAQVLRSWRPYSFRLSSYLVLSLTNKRVKMYGVDFQWRHDSYCLAFQTFGVDDYLSWYLKISSKKYFKSLGFRWMVLRTRSVWNDEEDIL